MKKEECESKNQWSEQGAIISGHRYGVPEVHKNCTVEILTCEHCGKISIGWRENL